MSRSSSAFRLLVPVVLLCVLGFGITAYKHVKLGVPLWAGEEVRTWLVEAKVSFISVDGEPVTARLTLPESIDERGVSQEAGSLGYGFLTEQSLDGPRAVWSASQVKPGAQALYYRLRLAQSFEFGDQTVPVLRSPRPPHALALPGMVDEAVDALVLEAKRKSSDPHTLFQHLMARVNEVSSSQELALIRRHYLNEERVSEEDLPLVMGRDLLARAGVASRKAYGVVLDTELGPQEPMTLIEYRDEAEWHARDPSKPSRTLADERIFVWSRGHEGLLNLYGGVNSKVVFTVFRDEIPLEKLETLQSSSFLASTILGLPASERAVFRYLVLIPIGAFVVVLMRNLVGISTLGTFMPVLLALAFLEMDLLSGIIMFAVIVAIGLYLRFLLSSMNLLVVPRVAACVVIVTLLMLGLSLISYKLEIRGVLDITLFPMIIIAWTIERMSLIWEEEGKRNALIQVSGSVIVAVLAYSVMQVRQIQYWAQYFPELLLVLLGAILLLGRYTGYRLSELFRFRNFEVNEP